MGVDARIGPKIELETAIWEYLDRTGLITDSIDVSTCIPIVQSIAKLMSLREKGVRALLAALTDIPCEWHLVRGEHGSNHIFIPYGSVGGDIIIELATDKNGYWIKRKKD